MTTTTQKQLYNHHVHHEPSERRPDRDGARGGEKQAHRGAERLQTPEEESRRVIFAVPTHPEEIVNAKLSMGENMKSASFAWTEAKYVAGEGLQHGSDSVEGKAEVRVKAYADNVAGVKIPKFNACGSGSGGEGGTRRRVRAN